jgi:hypothetical protein
VEPPAAIRSGFREFQIGRWRPDPKPSATQGEVYVDTGLSRASSSLLCLRFRPASDEPDPACLLGSSPRPSRVKTMLPMRPFDFARIADESERSFRASFAIYGAIGTAIRST